MYNLYDFVQVGVHLTLLLRVEQRQGEFWDSEGTGLIWGLRRCWGRHFPFRLHLTYIFQLNSKQREFNRLNSSGIILDIHKKKHYRNISPFNPEVIVCFTCFPQVQVFQLLQFPLSSQNRGCRWISYTKLVLGVNVCECMCAGSPVKLWQPTQSVFN